MSKMSSEFASLVAKRKIRRRQPGDGLGEDVGIGVVDLRLEKALNTLTDGQRTRMRDHVRDHAQEALKPILRLLELQKMPEEIALLTDVGPNMLRTIVEFLEEKK